MTIKDVARRAGVSFQTVSLVLNHPERVARTTRETIEAAMRELDFVPSLAARSLRKKPSRSIACVFSVGAQPYDDASGLMQETYQGLVLQTFAAVADQHGYTLIHRRWNSDDPDGLTRITSLVSEARVDGVVVFADRRNDPLIAMLQAKRFPFVVFGLDVPGTHFAMRAERDAVYEAVRYLVQTGSRSICFFKGERGGRRLRTVTERLRGYREALAEAGVPPCDDLVIPCDWNSESGYRVTLDLLDRSVRPDAIVAANDRVAFGVLKALHDRGVRVPDDIRVVGFDNFVQAAYTIPSLTSIEVPTLEMVRFTFATLVEVIEGTRAPDDLAQKLFPTRLVIRDSTGLIRSDVADRPGVERIAARGDGAS
ncbi:MULTISPECIES: LacI family DNA-binding transcriptional regulator [unclassified Methylobacterium]|uniref:LacI family DNA-binding transcriptional regulator n=1 Tax=unclassified Methylobacterium TaxID=2615210 RepID=UPI001354E746|nr:LacI family DNA-binding transcriptional regulator [Methylobacterium sp. 2A]MWV20505.1 LacI family transcriptional regulator [Methylobacterium sp. 2A]